MAALKSAARAAIVIPAVFALADKVIGKPQTSIFAAFGSFAVLVLVEFSGPPLVRLAAYGGLACVGVVFVTIGTLCSREPWLAAASMAIVGFATLFSGLLGSYVAAGSVAAILIFILPVTIPAPNSAIPDRLEGWGLACAAGICATMLLWPPRRRADLRRDVARALQPVADLAAAHDDQRRDLVPDARAAVERLGREFMGAQHRPTGPVGPTAALASLPDELDWLLSFLASPDESSTLTLACAEDGEALAAIAAVLRTSADRLDGGDGWPDFARLDAARDAVAQALVRRLPDLPDTVDDESLTAALEPPFRIRVAAYSAREIAASALRATGATPPEPGGGSGSRRTLEATEELAVVHASVRSVWFQNSIRGAAGLAVAVYIAQRTGLQHGFWVVLGTLSVLRSNALGTGWSILTALAGTAVGLVAGALLVLGIGTHEAVLWAVLPLAILVAAYAPRAISFAAGQAAFTVVLFVLFNIIQPVGWRVGLVRIEDVAIGFAISLGVGLLFWPRGAAARLRRDLAAAYADGADAVVSTARSLTDDGDAEIATRARRTAEVATHLLDDAFRQYLTERSATKYDLEDVAALVGGAARVRRSAISLAALDDMVVRNSRLDRCARHLDGELHALQSWYVALGYALENDRPMPPPHIRDTEGRTRMLACVREASTSGDRGSLHGAIVLLWASQHLDSLWRLEGHLRKRPSLQAAGPAGA